MASINVADVETAAGSSQTIASSIMSSARIKTDKSATSLRNNPKKWLEFLRKSGKTSKPATERYAELATNEKGSPNEPKIQLLRILRITAIGHFVVGAVGVILLAALGATATGGVLTGWSFCCAITSIILYFSIKWIPEPRKSRYISDLTQLENYVKIYILMTLAALVLGIATGIHGAVVLGEYAGRSPFYVYNGFVQFIPTFLYVGLGAGSVGLGITAFIIDAVLLKKLYDYLVIVRERIPPVKETVTAYREEAPQSDQFARVQPDDFSDYASPPPSYHSELKEGSSPDYLNEVQFAYSTYAQYIDLPVEDQWSTSSGLQRIETKL